MANRNWASGGKLYSMHVQPVLINNRILIGSSGSVSSFSGPMISSVSHVSTGIYEMDLQNNFNQLLSAHGSMQSPISGLSGISAIEIQNDPSSSVSDLSAPSLTIKCLDASGALADPASGSVIDVMAIMSNSSVNVQSSPVASE